VHHAHAQYPQLQVASFEFVGIHAPHSLRVKLLVEPTQSGWRCCLILCISSVTMPRGTSRGAANDRQASDTEMALLSLGSIRHVWPDPTANFSREERLCSIRDGAVWHATQRAWQCVCCGVSYKPRPGQDRSPYNLTLFRRHWSAKAFGCTWTKLEVRGKLKCNRFWV
jgi:hypothetical protein